MNIGSMKGLFMIGVSARRLVALTMLSLSAIALPQAAHATHFRGGSITWQAVDLDGDGNKNDVRITVKSAWRRDLISAATLTSSPSITGGLTQVSEEPRVCVGLGTTVNAPATCPAGTDYALTTTYFEAKNLDPNVHYTVAFSGGNRISNLQNNHDGTWNIQTTIYMKDGNLAPKVDLPIIIEVPMKQADGVTPLANWTFDVSSSDPNADKLRYRLANQSELGCAGTGCGYTNPPGLSINPNTGLLTWTGSGSLTAGNLYSAGIVAEDVDSVGAVKSKTHVDFILTLVNQAAVSFDPTTDITPSGGGSFPETRNVRVPKGTSYTFSVTASNVDTTSLGNLQGTLVESPANTFTFTPGPSGSGLDPGTYPITFQLSDQTNTHSDSYLVINFIVPNPNAPQILNIEGDRTTYSSSSTTPGDAAQSLVDQNLDAVVQDIDSTQLNGGFVLFNVTFTDGSYERLGIKSVGDGSGQIRFDGTDVYYQGQKIGTIDPTQDGVGRALKVNFTSNAATLAAVQAMVRSLTYQDTFTLRPAGDRALSIYIQDAQANSNSYDFFVNVQPHPSAPPAGGGPVQAANRMTVTEGTTVALSDSNISFADPDGDTITFTVSSVTHGQFELVSNPGTPVTTFTQQDVTLGKIAFAHDGSEIAPTYSLSASDGTHTTGPNAGDVTYFGVNDHAPTISGTPATSVPENVAYTFTPTASDADVGIGGQLTFSITNKPSWATFNTTTGQLSGTPAHSNVGTFTNIVISVSDDGGVTKVSLAAFSIAVLPDADGDGLPQGVDPDDHNPDIDHDGIPDGADVDVDGDGTPDNGVDTDGDGINDVADADLHPGSDQDHDGIIDAFDLDVDGDGIPNSVEGNVDTDGDGIPDSRDLDSDNDGIPDAVEGVVDTDGDGIPNYLDKDSDNDGIPDAVEGSADSDHDGIPNYLDADSDNDGIPDALESGAYGFDSDNDGIDDRWDADQPGAVDANHDGIADNVKAVDTDGDGIPDMLDLDSDNDGISDTAESGAKRTDSDGDGIDDAFDVDVVGGADANHDGVADSAKARDSDGDGVPDFRDLDSDNDSIPDVIESGGLDANDDGLLDAGGTITSSPRDSDGDGIADYIDLDSNNDGVKDIAGTVNARFDANGDGRVDQTTDLDGDGIADVVDGEPGQRGSIKDADGDGVPSSIDQDDDGDGIPDSVEGDADSDGDGVIDRLDHDSDNDGIPDRIEMGLPAPSGVDANHNGVDDAYEGMTVRDSDHDGIPDYLDTDSDNDGVSDAKEVLLVALSGVDSDGDGIDDAIDVDMTGGVDANHDGVDDGKVRIVDTDGDGIPDYLDSDSDNDGIPDGKEWGDFNHDGVNDALQKDPGLKTGLKGGGGGSFSWLMAFALLALALVRQYPNLARAKSVRAGVLMLALSMSVLQVQTAKAQGPAGACATGEDFSEGCWSIGVGAFTTTLQPDDSKSVWKVTDDSDVGFKLSAEYRFKNHWFLELGYADMGSATLTNRNPAVEQHERIDYSIPSLFGGYLLFDESNRFNVHAKVGYAMLSTNASGVVIDKQQHDNQIALGAGVRARLWRRVQLQFEYEYYDKDARQAGLMAAFAF